jgi:hypothetical protein
MFCSDNARRSAGLIAICAFAILCVRVYIQVQEGKSIFEALSFLTQFFTILTNSLVVVVFANVAIGRNVSRRVILATVVAIACVGGVFHVLLAHLQSLQGLSLWADHGVHTLIPVLSVVWWLAFAENLRVRLSEIGVCLLWPISYFVYVLVRASFSGFYPYPFLNVPIIGWGALVFNLFGMLVLFSVTAFVFGVLVRLRSGLLQALKP